MLLNTSLGRIAQKELTVFFHSPLAYLFLAIFVGISFFSVFWGEAFFARNIADIRPLFESMPIILIFLCSALTMRMWSEERRSGTLEFVMTAPIDTWNFVIGKFLACMVLLSIALALTFFLPITIGSIANLDWGPVFTAYLATLMLGATYIAIGLFVSSRSDNQIVSLMVSCLISGVFYFLGSSLLTDLFGQTIAEFFKQLGTGSRFESITRGVIDIRDIYYYISLTGIFLALNIFYLEKQRWAHGSTSSHHTSWKLVTGLLIGNLLIANFWLSSVNHLRVDTTEGAIYSISSATEEQIQQLQEPLRIRGFFSNKTHPLLSPLVPQLKDLLKEYQVVSNGKITTVFLDPIYDPELEAELNSKFGIQPVPFQVADRYQSALVQSYFNVVIEYGDQFEVLGFQDFIEVKSTGATDIDVQLRNPEYDITRAIKKVAYSYQSGGNLFANLDKKLTFTGFISSDEELPEALVTFKSALLTTLNDINTESKGKFDFSIKDPMSNNGQIAQDIAEQYGFQAMAASLLDTTGFYFHMLLSDEQQTQLVQVPIPENLDVETFKNTLDSGVKRFSSGFTKSIGFVTPPAQAPSMHGMPPQPTKQFMQLQQQLDESYAVKNIDLDQGRVAGDIDLLLVLSPEQLSESALFAIDQFLMQGGTVVIASSPFSLTMTNTELKAEPNASGLNSWLQHYGISIDNQFVMDKQSSPFPIPVPRNVGGMVMHEMVLLDYPYFVNIRESGMNQNTPVTSSLPEVTLAWPSPIRIDSEKNKSREVEKLLHSSKESWLSSDTNILPQEDGFVPEGDFQEHLLAVAVSGQFSSFFSGKTSPLLTENNPQVEENDEGEGNSDPGVFSTVIDKSSESSRIVLIASNDFASDQTLSISNAMARTEVIYPVQLVNNIVDWSLEDAGLLSISSRSHFSRTLPPMEKNEQVFMEYLNYCLALLGIIGIYFIIRWRKRVNQQRYQSLILKEA